MKNKDQTKHSKSGKFEPLIKPVVKEQTDQEFIAAVRLELIQGTFDMDRITKAYQLLGYTNPSNVVGMKSIITNTIIN
jgi:hypothetical protein